MAALAWCCTALLLAAAAPAAAGKVTTPRFKWGQNKEQIFLSVMVRDLEKSSVSVTLPSEGDLAFRAKSAKGEDFALDLPLREDVKSDGEAVRWEVSQRPDKWGTAVVISLAKRNEHRWDVLTTTPKKFKGLIDKDWAREDQTLEPEDELNYAEDHSAYLVSLTAKNLAKTVSKSSAVIVNVRYPWCSQCKSQDDTFAKAAKMAKGKGKKDALWKKAAFAVLDAREERGLARKLGAKCDFSCEYRVYTEADEEPVPFKAKWSEEDLLGELAKFLSPAVRVLQGEAEQTALKATNTTCVGGFASEKSPRFALFKRVASLMRGELVFAATLGKDEQVQVWPLGQNFSFKYGGSWEDNGTAFHDWLKPRALPLLQDYDWQMRETYEKLELPMAKVWIDDEDKNPSFEKTVRHVLRSVAKKFIGRIAFVEQKKTTYSYELRDYGLNTPEAFPAIGISSNASYNAVKYGFEITPDVAPSVQEFWTASDSAVAKLSDFCSQVLAGTWPEAHESGTPQTNWTLGAVKQIVWKTYKELQQPELPLLLEVYGKYRSEHEGMLVLTDNLAKALEPHAASFAVARYDTGENYFPPGDFPKRDKYSTDTEWFWVPKGGGAMKKLAKAKKAPPAPALRVLEFAKAQSGLELSTEALLESFEEQMKANPPPPPRPDPPMDEGGMMGGMGGMGGMDQLGDMGGMGSLADMGLGGLGDMAGMGMGGGEL